MPNATFSALKPFPTTACRMARMVVTLMPSPWITPAPLMTLKPFALVVLPNTLSSARRACRQHAARVCNQLNNPACHWQQIYGVPPCDDPTHCVAAC